MPKLNQDLNYRDIYLTIRERIPMDFIADRTDIGFNNIEEELLNINFTIPFRIPEVQNLRTIIDILVQESTGYATKRPYD